jgi:hypothetical protein
MSVFSSRLFAMIAAWICRLSNGIIKVS